MSTEKQQQNFPYVSYPTFKTFIAHLHETIVTDQIDNTMMPSKMSGGARSAVISALKAIGLVDLDNSTTTELKQLVDSYNSKDWPAMLKKNVLSAYDEVAKGIDLKTTTRKQIEGIFEEASPQMKDKYIRFFLSVNKDAGIAYSPHLKIRKRKSTKKRSDKSDKKNGISGEQENKPKTPKKEDLTPLGMFDLPIPIAQGSFIRIPKNITINQVTLIQAAIGYLKAMAEQNKESE